MTFLSCKKNGFIRKIWLASKLIMSQPGEQTVTIYILPNISPSKGNWTMKLGQLKEYKKKIIVLKYTENQAGRLLPDLFLCF